MGLAKDSITAVQQALQNVYGFTAIERRASLELMNVKSLPYATLIVTSVEYGSDTFGEVLTTCEVTGGLLFSSESDLLEAMDHIEEFKQAVADYVEVNSLTMERLSNDSRVKQFNYAMVFVINTQGDWK